MRTSAERFALWEAFLKPTSAGGPFEMAIAGSNTIQIKDVLVGEVWVASGQSNMAFTMKRVAGAQELLATAANPKIRLFNVARKSEL